jgi:hypothetical protein
MCRLAPLTGLAVLAGLLVAGGCGTAARVTATASHAAAATPAATTRTMLAGSPIPRTSRKARATRTEVDRRPRASVPSAAGAASGFAGAYARYLDGQLPAAALPYLSPGAQGEIGPPIPRPARAGDLTVQSVQQTPGAPTFTVQLKDRAHTFPAQLTVGPAVGRWLVTSILAPDIDTILHSQSTPIPQPRGSGPAGEAARGFIGGYLLWLYAAGPATAIRDATSQLIARLKANPPNVPPTFQGLRGRLDSLGLRRTAGGWRAFALITDPRTSYTLEMSVQLVSGRWLVASVGPAT